MKFEPSYSRPLVLALAATITFLPPAGAQLPGASDTGGQDTSGSSAGFPGVEDNEQVYLDRLHAEEKKGKTRPEYVASLLELGMHYNRNQRFKDAARVLSLALSTVDKGAMKPTPKQGRIPDKVIETHHPDGTVSAQIVRQPMPYEETLSALLPQLVTAEIGAGRLTAAEMHVRRLIALEAPDPVRGKLNLMSAYTQYAELLEKQHRAAEAEAYRKKANEINSSFKPL